MSDPVPDGLGRGLELTGEVCGVASSADQLDDPTTELSGIRRACVGHRMHLVEKPDGLHESGPTSIETMHTLRKAPSATPLFPELSVVATLRDLKTDDGLTVPAGSRGTIVEVYASGSDAQRTAKLVARLRQRKPSSAHEALDIRTPQHDRREALSVLTDAYRQHGSAR